MFHLVCKRQTILDDRRYEHGCGDAVITWPFSTRELAASAENAADEISTHTRSRSGNFWTQRVARGPGTATSARTFMIGGLYCLWLGALTCSVQRNHYGVTFGVRSTLWS